jgi:hypothetical protein
MQVEIMNHRRFRISRLGLPLVVAAAGCVTSTTADARGPRLGSGAGPGAPQGPIFKTLDAMAGGIEYVLERTVLAQRTQRRSSSCDAIGCDDACDHLTLQQLEPMAIGGPQGQRMPHPHLQGAAPLQHPGDFSHGDDQHLHAQPMHAHPMHAHPAYGGQAEPRGLPRVPSDHAPAPLSSEESWIESFIPAQPQGRNGQPRRRMPRDEQYDALPDPFLDDPQGGR